MTRVRDGRRYDLLRREERSARRRSSSIGILQPLVHEIVLQYPDREETVSTSGSLPVGVGGILAARGFSWFVERVEESDNPPKRRYICTRDWNDGALEMKVVAQFDPPDAHPAARNWREEHEAILSQLPDEAIRIDVGRAVGGDFVRISVADEYAARFADP